MDILNTIINLYKEVRNIYLKLYNLELDNKIDGVEYLNLVNLLKDKIKEEKLLIKKLFRYYGDEVYKVCNLINDDFLKKRLMDSLNLYVCLNGEDGLSKEEKLEQMKIDRLFIECYRNMNLIYYSFLQEYIDLDICSDIKDLLLKIKYDNSFVNHDMECQLINNNFNVPQINYVVLNLVIDMLRIENNDMMLDCFAERILTSIYDILSINDNDYNDNKNIIKSINSQCILRAGLVMVNELDFNELFSEINDIINRNTNNNCISLGIVNVLIAKRIKDKERVKKLSLRPLCE